jgi:hypothetical protein
METGLSGKICWSFCWYKGFMSARYLSAFNVLIRLLSGTKLLFAFVEIVQTSCYRRFSGRAIRR